MNRYLPLLGFLILVVSCAVVMPPSGGPEDKMPPEITGITPAEDSAGVARNSIVEVRFSEKVDGDSFTDRISIYPPVDFDRIDVKGNRIEIKFSEDLPETTLCLVVRSGFKDQHLVASKKNGIFYFATTPSLLKGGISGKVMFKREADSTAVVKLIELKADTISDIFNQQESRMAFASGNGDYSFRALPTDSSKFRIWAFRDVNNDGRYAVGKEFSLVMPDTFILTPDRPQIRNVEINIIDPNEPGSLSGRVINGTGLDILPMIRLENILPDESPLVEYADTLGNYIFKALKPGRYIFNAFIDVNPDSLPGTYHDPSDSTVILAEPAVSEGDTIGVSPGENKVLPPVTLKRKSADEK